MTEHDTTAETSDTTLGDAERKRILATCQCKCSFLRGSCT